VKPVHFLLFLCVKCSVELWLFFANDEKELFSLKPETIGVHSLIYCLLRKQYYATVFTQLHRAGKLPGQL